MGPHIYFGELRVYRKRLRKPLVAGAEKEGGQQDNITIDVADESTKEITYRVKTF